MKRNDVIFLLTSTLIMSIAWVVFSVIHASITSTISGDLSQQIEPIPPVFDAKTITNITNRQKIVPLYSVQNSATVSGNIVVQPTPTPTITISLSPTNVSSQGGVSQ